MSTSHNKIFTTSSLFNVEGQTVLVTGGATGIGLMIAQAFGNNGARVYIASRREDTLNQTADVWGKSLVHSKGEIIPVQADITDKSLVNNAGVSLGTTSTEKGEEGAHALKNELWKESWEDWEDTHPYSYFFTSVAFLPLLSAAKRPDYTPCVINVSSISGITRTSQHHFKYNVSKAATIHLNTLLAQEFSQSGVQVRVNSIAPGIFPSQMTTEGKDDKNKSQIPTGDDYGEKKDIPAGRPGAETDMAQTALFIACNQYFACQTVAVDGGYLLKHP